MNVQEAHAAIDHMLASDAGVQHNQGVARVII
jgi:hypothetical protein